MQLSVLLILSIVAFFLSALFLALSKKFDWNFSSVSSFECGFSSYFYSRFSFSIHYFLVGLVFLFLDLELCFLMPFMVELTESDQTSLILIVFVMFMLVGLLAEWANKKLNWNF